MLLHVAVVGCCVDGQSLLGLGVCGPHRPPQYLGNAPGGVQASASQSPDPHWNAPVFYSPGGMLCVSVSIGWCRTENCILSYSMPVVLTLSAFFFFFFLFFSKAKQSRNIHVEVIYRRSYTLCSRRCCQLSIWLRSLFLVVCGGAD